MFRPPATEEHPIIQRYSGVSFLDECQAGHSGHLSEESEQEESDQDNNNSVHSGGSLPGLMQACSIPSQTMSNQGFSNGLNLTAITVSIDLQYFCLNRIFATMTIRF